MSNNSPLKPLNPIKTAKIPVLRRDFDVNKEYGHKTLEKDPEKRWSAAELLSHNYFNGFSFKLPPEEGSYESLNKDNRKKGPYLPQIPQTSHSDTGHRGASFSREPSMTVTGSKTGLHSPSRASHLPSI